MQPKQSRVSDEMSLAIVRGYHLEGRTQSELAKEYDVSQTTIHMHVHGTVNPHIYAKVAAEEVKAEPLVMSSAPKGPPHGPPHGPAPKESGATFGQVKSEEEVIADWEGKP